MDEDNPDYLVHEIFTQNFWKDHPLGTPILGTKETVKRFDAPPVFDFYAQRFSPGNMMISAAGNLNHERVCRPGRKAFRRALKPVSNGFHEPAPKILPRIVLRNKKSLEQVQICIGVPSYPISHERRHASYILNTLLGGGMSSRLFQNIRETPGTRLRHLQRTESLSRHRLPVGLRRHIERVGSEGRRSPSLPSSAS